MEINIPISRENYYKGFLKVINAFLGLTKSELEVIACMLENDIMTLTRESRRTIRELTGKSQHAFNNMTLSLKKSSTLIKIKGGLILNPQMINNIANKTIKVTFHITGERLSDVAKPNEYNSVPSEV